MTVDKLSNIVIGLAIKAHRHLSPGLLESSYKCVCFMRLPWVELKE